MAVTLMLLYNNMLEKTNTAEALGKARLYFHSTIMICLKGKIVALDPAVLLLSTATVWSLESNNESVTT